MLRFSSQPGRPRAKGNRDGAARGESKQQHGAQKRRRDRGGCAEQDDKRRRSNRANGGRKKGSQSKLRPRSLLGALGAARTTAKAHEPNQATWPRMMRTGPSRRPHWRPARPADAQLSRSDTRGDGPGRVVDVVVEIRQPAAQARIRGPAGLNRYSRTTVADHEIAHLSHCLAIKFSETAEGNCRQDLGVTIEIWGSSR